MARTGSKDPLVLLLRFTGLLKVSPPSVLFVKKISAVPGLSSSHTTKMSFLLSLNTSGSDEFPLFLLKFMGLSLNVFPPSVLFFNNMSKKPVEFSCHTKYASFSNDAIDGNSESTMILFALWVYFIGLLNVFPPSVLFAKNMSKLS